MFSLIKVLLYCAVVSFAVYALFFKDVGGKSIARHVSEVWDSDLVQRKVDSIKADMREDLELRLAKARAGKGEAKGVHDGRDYISESDRESLSALIEKKTQKK